MTIQPRWLQPLLLAVSFDYLLPSCDIASCIKTRHRSLTNLLIRGKVVPHGDVAVETANRGRSSLSLMLRWESDMARPKQSKSGLGIDRRQLLASAAALSIGTIPGIEAAAEVANSGPSVTIAEIARSETARCNVCAGTARKIEEIVARNIIRAEARACPQLGRSYPEQTESSRK